MHNRADQFAKNILRDALSRISTSETEVEVLAATQKIDVYSVPDPARDAERARMGQLGALSAEPGLFEPFRNTPTLRQLRRCVNKQLTWHHELERRARVATGSAVGDGEAEESAPLVTSEVAPFPALIAIGPGRPETVLDAYGCKPVSPGVYHAVWGLVLRIVVLAELPRTRETLLLRLLGSGRLLREALVDLGRLPDDAWEKSIATPLLIHFRLGSEPLATNKEDDVSAEIQAWFEDYQQKMRAEMRTEAHNEGLNEGLNQGRTEEAARAVLTALRVRNIAVPESVRERILAQKDPEVLERWHERAIVAASLAEMFGGITLGDSPTGRE